MAKLIRPPSKTPRAILVARLEWILYRDDPAERLLRRVEAADLIENPRRAPRPDPPQQDRPGRAEAEIAIPRSSIQVVQPFPESGRRL
jgi:hypothetical protein